MAINERISVLALTILAILAAALIAALTFGGGAKRTIASRSAAAFREAERKGEPVGESAHGHGALSPAAAGHAAHAGHGGVEMKEPGSAEGRKGHPSDAAGDHADMQHGSSSVPPKGRPGGDHAGMHHGAATAAGTSRDPMPRAPMVSPPAPKAAEASPGQPAATLQADPLDRPAETSVLDARRSAEMAAEMHGGHGMQHGTTSYRQLDAGRDVPDHSGMQHDSPPAAPKPPPKSPTPGAPAPQPTHPPHHSGGNDEGSRHGEATR